MQRIHTKGEGGGPLSSIQKNAELLTVLLVCTDKNYMPGGQDSDARGRAEPLDNMLLFFLQDIC